MKQSKNMVLLSILACLMPIVIGLILYGDLPEMIPVHFNMNNQADNWYPKPVALFGMPIGLTLLQVFCLFVTSKDLKNKDNPFLMSLVIWIIPIIGLVVYLMCVMTALQLEINIGMIVKITMGVIFIVLGNYMPKCRQNFTIGIRIPTTLQNEENWNKTHRLAGFIWVLGGIIILFTSLLEWHLLFFITTLFMAFIPIIYSFILK